MNFYESFKKNLKEADENLRDIYYFMVGICLDENRPDADEDEFYDEPEFGIPYKLMDENYGVERELSEAYGYVMQYVKNGVPGTFGVIVKAKEPFEGFVDGIENGINDSMDLYDVTHYKENGGELIFCAYSTKDGSVKTVVNKSGKENNWVPSKDTLNKLYSLFKFVSDKYNRELFNSDGIDQEVVELISKIGTDIYSYDSVNKFINDLKFATKFINDNKEYFHDGIAFEIVDMINDVIKSVLDSKLKESTNLKEGTFGEEVGFSEYSDIDAMEEEFATKVCEYLVGDSSYASYFKFNKFELHRGMSWTDSNPWMLVDVEIPDNLIYEIIESNRNIAPTAYQLDSANYLTVYSSGIEIGRLHGDRSYEAVSAYTTLEPHYSWYDENKKPEVEKALTNEEDSVCNYIEDKLTEHYQDLLNIMLENEYVDEEDYEEIDESDDCNPAWFRNRALYREYKEFVDGQLRDGAIDDPDYIKELSDEEYEDLLVNTWMQDKGMQQAFSEIYGMPIDGSLKEADKPKKYTEDDFDTLEDAVKELEKVTGIKNYFTKEEWDAIDPDDIKTCNYYIKDIIDNYLNVPSTHIKESEKTVLTKFDWEDGLEDFEYYTDEDKDIYAKNKKSGRLYFCTGDGDPETEIEDDTKYIFKESENSYTLDDIRNMVSGIDDAEVALEDIEIKAKSDELVDLINSRNFKDTNEIVEFIIFDDAVDNLRSEGSPDEYEVTGFDKGKELERLHPTFEEIASKQVPDSDGFMTDYTMYKKPGGGYVFVFGDKELNNPEDAYYDWEEDNEDAAKDWFDSYNGFNED